ncbi:MAG: flagellar basal body P-ring protein FlgI, partial [Phycisphaerales bacterium]
MRAVFGHCVFWIGCLAAAGLLAGCGRLGRSERSAEDRDEAELGPTIASVAEVGRPEALVVEGYGLVGGLSGTGSSVCPTGVRTYLKSYILSQLPDQTIDPDELIDSKDTAVVRLEGVMPAVVAEGEGFDVRVRLVEGSDATSLRDGWLYEAELRPLGTAQVQSRVLATTEGPVFINLLDASEPSLTDGLVLGAGVAKHGYAGGLRLGRADYPLASAVRNRLNERYGVETAQAISAEEIEFKIPAAYQRRRVRFVSMVAATYLSETPELVEKRIDTLLSRLSVSAQAERSEIALEALGPRCLPKLATLLEAPDEAVRVRAARCMLYLGDDAGWAVLRAVALDQTSAYRLEALDAIVAGAQRNDAATLARRLLRDSDKRVVLAAYEHLRELEDMAVRQEFVGRSFYLEQVLQTDRKAIFVARRGDPRVVIFGGPLVCRDSLFVESPDGAVMVDSRVGQDFASLTRRIPGRPEVIGPLRSGLTLSEIVRGLGAEPRRAGSVAPAGLGVSYTDVTAVLEQLT